MGQPKGITHKKFKKFHKIMEFFIKIMLLNKILL